MKNQQMPKDQWIEEVYKLLCVSQGAPIDDNEAKNLREWAEVMASTDNVYYEDGMTPKEAHDEELSYA